MDNNNLFNENQSGSQTSGGMGQPNEQQYQYQQQQYQQPQYQQPQYQPELEEPMTLGDWLITTLIMVIPCVGIVMMFIWAFNGSEKKSKSNYCKAMLIWMAISLVLSLIGFVTIGTAIFSVFSNFY